MTLYSGHLSISNSELPKANACQVSSCLAMFPSHLFVLTLSTPFPTSLNRLRHLPSQRDLHEFLTTPMESSHHSFFGFDFGSLHRPEDSSSVFSPLLNASSKFRTPSRDPVTLLSQSTLKSLRVQSKPPFMSSRRFRTKLRVRLWSHLDLPSHHYTIPPSPP